jgi:adenosylcobinamide-phosphate synthase
MLMERSSLLAAAYGLDWLIGDPEWMPHPVRGMGWAIANSERIARKSGSGKRWELVTGGLLAATVPLVSALAAKRTIFEAHGRCRSLGLVIEVWLGATCLGSRNLLDEAIQILRVLDADNIALACKRLARMVGRDTESLNESEISRALIETLAESLCDGIIAPLFYLTLGGVPAGIAYKAVNTLDSMIGHKNARYFWFGRVAARLDDVANWIPARIAAILICVAAKFVCGQASSLRAVRTWLRDGSHHASPNAGQVESAMAGALGVRLGGSNFYDGERLDSPFLGKEFQQPHRFAAGRAVRVVAVASVLGATVAWLLTRRRQNGG